MIPVLRPIRKIVETRLEEFLRFLYRGKSGKPLKTLQLDSLKTIESKLKEYESGFYPRFDRLEQFMSDLDALEGSLRQSLDEAKTGILDEFAPF